LYYFNIKLNSILSCYKLDGDIHSSSITVYVQAFSESGTVLSESLKPVKETIVSMLQLGPQQAIVKSKSTQNGESSGGIKAGASALHEVQSCMPTPTDSVKQETSIDPCNSEKFPAPSTPQLEQGGRSPSEEDKTLRLDDATNLMVGTTHVENNCGYETIREVRLDVEETSAWSSQVDNICLFINNEQQSVNDADCSKYVS
jgi:hypothetical protein